MYQSLSNFQTGIGATSHATLDTEQFISHTIDALVDSISSLQGSDEGVITVSEVHELLTKICDILNSTVYKWVGNIADFLAYINITLRTLFHLVRLAYMVTSTCP